MTAVNETQLGLDHNRQKCPPILPPPELQIHKHINRQHMHVSTQAHMFPLVLLALSNTNLEATRQAATHFHIMLITLGLLSHSNEPD